MNKIKTKEANKSVVLSTTRKYDFKEYRAIAQIAIAYSIQINKKFELENSLDLLSDNKGQEFPESLLGSINNQSNDCIYRAILNQYYEKRLSDEEFSKYIKLHLDHGLEVLEQKILLDTRGKNTHIDFLLNAIKNGLSLIDSSPSLSQIRRTSREVGAFNDLLEIELGKDAETAEPMKIRINDENHFDSQHFAVAGMNGSGKTQLVKDILYQISQQTNSSLKFIFFDYKGEGKSDSLKGFLNATKCEFLNIKDKPFVFNPLKYIDLANERNQQLGIKSFRDTIASIDKHIGVKQKNSLEIALRNAFESSKKNGTHPSIPEVHNALTEYYEETNAKPDTLTSIIKELSEVVFADDYDPNFNLHDRSNYINLPPTLPESARQASVFLLLNYLLSEFISLDDVKTSPDRIKPIRYIIVIDEAHVYLNGKNMAKKLEEILRMIRSKGVIVMMLSQGIEEYKQKEFDFTSQINITILLNIQNKDLKSTKSFLGTPKSETPLKTALRKLDSQKGIVDFGTPQLIEIHQFWKRGL